MSISWVDCINANIPSVIYYTFGEHYHWGELGSEQKISLSSCFFFNMLIGNYHKKVPIKKTLVKVMFCRKSAVLSHILLPSIVHEFRGSRDI